MFTWLQVTPGVLALLAALVLGGWWWGPRRWDADTDGLRNRLVAQARRDPGLYGHAELRDLPPPVVRYFRRVLPEGRPLIAHARIAWAGSFNMGAPGKDKWTPFTAVQDFVPGGPGMLWNARIAMVPGLSVRVRDALVDGRGSMRGAVLGLIAVADNAGTPEMARASLQRYLAEATWFPTALLPSQGVLWTAIDDDQALATLCAGGVSVSVEFRFGGEGRPTSIFVPDRLYDDGHGPPALRPWRGRNISFATHQGVLVPDHAIAEWLLPGGVFAYWKGHPVTITYE
jgi:hypothetical protein